MTNNIFERFELGIKKFNEGEFYDCHDILEDIWFDIRGSSRRFYQGLIHLAVGFHHLTRRNNLNGTISQLNKGIAKLTEYTPEFQGVELRKLLVKISGCVKNAEEMNEGRLMEFDFRRIPKINFKKASFKKHTGAESQ